MADSVRNVYTVEHPAHDYDLTVIAESPADAINLAIAYYEEENDTDRYGAYSSPAPNEGRWVQFESREGAEEQLSELQRCGAKSVWTRVHSHGSFDAEPVLWEIGANDHTWGLLPRGILCGGDQ